MSFLYVAFESIRKVCGLWRSLWSSPAENQPPSTWRFLSSCRYYVCVAVLIYFLPLLVMGCAYLVVGLTLWASEIPGDSSDRYREQLSAKRKVGTSAPLAALYCPQSVSLKKKALYGWDEESQ